VLNPKGSEQDPTRIWEELKNAMISIAKNKLGYREKDQR